MEFGASIFFTEYSISPAVLAPALEERGFDSLWAYEHSHIPVSRRSPLPGGANLERAYHDAMDPFVTLAVAATVTTRLKVGTAVCLVIQHDTIQTAKLVASLDQISQGRFLFGIGGGWNAEEMENHGTDFRTRFARLSEQVAAMKEMWTKDAPEFHGKFVKFSKMMMWPKPAQKPHPPILVGGAFQYAAPRAIRYGDGLLPAGRALSGDPKDFMPRFHRMAREAGRDPASLPVTLSGAPEDVDVLRRYRDLGIARVRVGLRSEKKEDILPVLDRWAEIIRRVRA